jgi:hypothetical protein
MDKELQNFIRTAKAVKMSANEKALLRANLLKTISTPITSPYHAPSPYARRFSFLHMHFAKALVIVLIAALAGGGGLSAAASEALPGDILYPVKVNFNEKVRELAIRTPEARVAWKQEKIERRLDELNALMESGKLNETASRQVENYIEKGTEEFHLAVAVLEREDKVEAAAIATAKFAMVFDTHPAVTRVVAQASIAETEIDEEELAIFGQELEDLNVEEELGLGMEDSEEKVSRARPSEAGIAEPAATKPRVEERKEAVRMMPKEKAEIARTEAEKIKSQMSARVANLIEQKRAEALEQKDLIDDLLGVEEIEALFNELENDEDLNEIINMLDLKELEAQLIQVEKMYRMSGQKGIEPSRKEQIRTEAAVNLAPTYKSR